MEDLLKKINGLLNRLGVTANYTGFFQMAYALKICAEQQDRLLFITKLIYPDVAKHFHTNWRAVERNMRTVGNIIWQENRTLLEDLACRPLHQKPTTAQLLAILVMVLNQHSSSEKTNI